jgi:hypothetical protein
VKGDDIRRMNLTIGVLLLPVMTSAHPKAHYRTGAGGVLLADPDTTPGATVAAFKKNGDSG